MERSEKGPRAARAKRKTMMTMTVMIRRNWRMKETKDQDEVELEDCAGAN